MRAARIYGFGDVRIEEMPDPFPGPGEVVVRVRACGICTSDTLRWYIEKKTASGPIVLGHEPAGEVAALGSGVTNYRVGDPIFLHHHAPCGCCRRCLRGDYVHCPTWRRSGIDPGGCAELVRVTAESVAGDSFALPAGMTPERAALIEPLACSVKALRRGKMKEGSHLFILGLGVMGSMEVLLGRALGAEKIFGADFHPWRRAKGLELGCDAVFDPASGELGEQLRDANEGEGADLVVVHPTSGEALEAGIDCAAAGGTVVIYSPCAPELSLPINPHDLYFDEVSLVPSYSCGPDDTRAASRLIASGKFDTTKVVTHVLPLEEAQRAFDLTAAAGESLKVLVRLGPPEGALR